MRLPEGGPGPERGVAWACAAVALSAAVVVPLVWSLTTPFVPRGRGGLDGAVIAYSVLWLVPAAAALIAVVLTRIRWVGVSIAVIASLLTTVVGTADFLVRGGDPEVIGVLGWLLVAAVSGMKLLAADLMARRLSRFTARTGAMAGVLVGLLGGLIALASNGVVTGGGRLDLLPAVFWISTFVLTPALLGVTGSVAGQVAAQRSRVPA